MIPLAAKLFAPLLANERNQQASLQRALVAKANGLEPEIYGAPYPGSTVTNTSTDNRKEGGWLKGALVGAALLAGGAGAGLMATGALKSPPSATQAPAPAASSPAPTPPAVTPPADPHWDAVWEEQDPASGAWREVERERLK